MTWTQSGHLWRSGPYHTVRTVRGWDVWLTGDKRVGRDVTTLRAAKALAELHANGDKRVPVSA